MTKDEKIHVATTEEVLVIASTIVGVLKQKDEHPLLMWAALDALAGLLWDAKADQYTDESKEIAKDIRDEMLSKVIEELE